ncbi:MAG: hypothetical protein QOG96_5192 [Pseudonocardiales bacterium]|nr:hypothetical protein [Pseudonocardiales bacterium]
MKALCSERKVVTARRLSRRNTSPRRLRGELGQPLRRPGPDLPAECASKSDGPASHTVDSGASVLGVPARVRRLLPAEG